MKKLLFLLAFIAILVGVTPRSFAYDRSPWHDADKIVGQLHERFHDIIELRRHYGSNPEIRDQMARLHAGIDRLSYLVSNRIGDPDYRHKQGENLSSLASEIEAEYRHPHYWW